MREHRNSFATVVIYLVLLTGFTLLSTKASQAEAVARFENAPFRSVALQSLPAQDGKAWAEREELLRGVNSTLNYLYSSKAGEDYAKLPGSVLSLERAIQSAERFKELLLLSHTSREFHAALDREFTLMRSPGVDGRGTVLFTGYFQAELEASRFRSGEFQYPIYRAPYDFNHWKLPHPRRVALEGYDGKGSSASPLQGEELFFFRTRYEAFMVQLQGSAILNIKGEGRTAVGFSAATKHPFVGLGRNYLREKKVSWTNLHSFFQRFPGELNYWLSRNNRMVFFEENPHPHPIGSLGVPVLEERSIATDKTRYPPGSIAFIRTRLPRLIVSEGGDLLSDKKHETVMAEETRIVFDLDCGSAIRGLGRVDIFMGTGKEGFLKASAVNGEGELFYLGIKSLQQNEDSCCRLLS